MSVLPLALEDIRQAAGDGTFCFRHAAQAVILRVMLGKVSTPPFVVGVAIVAVVAARGGQKRSIAPALAEARDCVVALPFSPWPSSPSVDCVMF